MYMMLTVSRARFDLHHCCFLRCKYVKHCEVVTVVSVCMCKQVNVHVCIEQKTGNEQETYSREGVRKMQTGERPKEAEQVSSNQKI